MRRRRREDQFSSGQCGAAAVGVFGEFPRTLSSSPGRGQPLLQDVRRLMSCLLTLEMPPFFKVTPFKCDFEGKCLVAPWTKNVVFINQNMTDRWLSGMSFVSKLIFYVQKANGVTRNLCQMIWNPLVSDKQTSFLFGQVTVNATGLFL